MGVSWDGRAEVAAGHFSRGLRTPRSLSASDPNASAGSTGSRSDMRAGSSASCAMAPSPRRRPAPAYPAQARRRSASSRDRCSESETRLWSRRQPIRRQCAPLAGPFPACENVDAWARPSTPGSSSTNAPNSASRVTRPVRTWPTSYEAWIVDHGSSVSCFNPSAIFCAVVVHAQHLDRDFLAGETTCDVSDTRDHPISDTWSRPCTPAPRSTNAPKSRTDVTRPVITSPTTIERRSSAAVARCSSSSRARREMMRFRPPSLCSMIRKA